MPAYYNEIDAAACAVLRELSARGVIAPGDVDSRSIKDVQPGDLAGYDQHHFFAGGGLWSVAARLAGWPDDRKIWTASCPCQGESLAGKRLGADDPRHLWPDLYRLIRACRPAIVVGEQVAAAAGTHWLDGVCADLDAESYAARAVDIPACAVDAPHQRNRLWWVALDDSERARLERQRGDGDRSEGWPYSAGSTAEADGELFADAARIGRREGWPEHEFRSGQRAAASGDAQLQSDADSGRRAGRAEASEWRPEERAAVERPHAGLLTDAGRELRRSGPGIAIDGQVGPNLHGRNGSWWADAEWIVSPLDGKARRTKPGLPFLVDGLPGRVDLWRIGGNAISPILAAEVIAALKETLDG